MKTNQEIGTLFVRVILGIIFFLHGLQAYQGGLGGTAAFFGQIGVPEFMAYIVKTIELVGGIALILGLGTRLFAALFVPIMAVAIITVGFARGFVGGYEFELSLMVMALYLTLSGSKMLSIDGLLKQQQQSNEAKFH
ncbi:DoxX family protein [Bacillus altitudinis MN12]|uniref:DoxX family protein n=2 Tax=Bacillus TaxID=1386 RepID=A0ABV1S345_BACAB|nr:MULTISPECIES: DoxX family protein [Bacillus]AHL70893.1 oxidoreductase [Bacillus pumilus]KML02075.1 oxidoreductase [Bacillus stratosphericus]KQL47912.1 oxidoreductase [Bacillus sp. FJAT-21955]MBW3700106.1 DoxX family protein [Bacillus aerophilus]MDH8709780.1 putative oxidoreductase [Micromonospora sp. 1209]CVM59293.1 Inner membrane protein yqjF [Streptococcus pneumoniae]